VLRAFDRATPELSVADLARRLDESRSVLARILLTLERARFVERSEVGFYRIGLAACEVGAVYLKDNALVVLANKTLSDLARITGCAAYLGKLSGANIIIVGVHEGSRPIRYIWSVGDRLPVATTALGKAMLMEFSRAERDRIVGTEELKGLTARSLRLRADLESQIAQYRPSGWIPMNEESYPGICAVGAPVLSAEGQPVAGISLSFIGALADTEQIEQLGRVVVEASTTISTKLRAQAGYGSIRPPAGSGGDRLDRPQSSSRNLRSIQGY